MRVAELETEVSFMVQTHESFAAMHFERGLHAVRLSDEMFCVGQPTGEATTPHISSYGHGEWLPPCPYDETCIDFQAPTAWP